MSHTPGPWFASTVVEGAVSAKANPRENLLGIDVDGYAIFMNPDDAVLAAAAPEMLAALNYFLQRHLDLVNCGDCGNWDPETDLEVIQARAAITKAQGGAA